MSGKGDPYDNAVAEIFSVVLNVSVSISIIIFQQSRPWLIFFLILRLFITLFDLILLLAGSLLTLLLSS